MRGEPLLYSHMTRQSIHLHLLPFIFLFWYCSTHTRSIFLMTTPMRRGSVAGLIGQTQWDVICMLPSGNLMKRASVSNIIGKYSMFPIIVCARLCVYALGFTAEDLIARGEKCTAISDET